MNKDYLFIENHISKENIGEHDADNFFLCEEVKNQVKAWQERHEGCTLIGVCYEEPHPRYHGFYAVVYEDENGNRFWTHWNIDEVKEYMKAGLL